MYSLGLREKSKGVRESWKKALEMVPHDSMMKNRRTGGRRTGIGEDRRIEGLPRGKETRVEKS